MITASSAEWFGLKQWLAEQIGQAHKDMETVGLPEAATNVLRGQIVAYRHIIATVEPAAIEGGGATKYT